MHNDDEVVAQLNEELRAASAKALESRRPLLTHLNADTSWLLSLPVPGASVRSQGTEDVGMDDGDGSRVDAEKAYFHILLDPWLRGSQSDVANFFSQQWHVVESACQSISEVEDAIRGIEALVSRPPSSLSSDLEDGKTTSPIDAVVVSHEFTDHMHKDTLLEIHRSVPVFASSKAASIIKSWKYFDSVQELKYLTPRSTDWRSTSVPPLPSWIGIGRVAKDGVDLLYYHSAVLVTFSASYGAEEAEAVVYTPHGITPADLAPLASSTPKIRTLALLHGLNDMRVSKGQLNLGAHNGLKALRLTGAKHWIGTHDEIKKGGGLVSWFLQRNVLTVKEALEKEVSEKGDGDELEDVNFEDVRNGETLVLR